MKNVVPINDSVDATAAPTMHDLQNNGKAVRSAKLDAMVTILRDNIIVPSGSVDGSRSANNGLGLNVIDKAKSLYHDINVIKSESNSPGTSSAPSNKVVQSTVLKKIAKHKKAVIFTQWTYMLDLISIVLKKENFNFVRLDGSMSQAKREKAVQEFKEEDHIQIMVMSLKAGGTCARG